MTFFQMIMLAASAFFAYKIYEHIQTLKDEESGVANPNDGQRSADAFSVFSPESLKQRADEAYENEEYQKAIALLEEANAKEPRNDETLFKLGYILQKTGNMDSAIERYKEALAIDDKDAIVHNALASAYRANKEYASAKMHLNASLALDEANAITYFNYGNLLVDSKHYEEARGMYEKALEINPDFTEAKEVLEGVSGERHENS